MKLVTTVSALLLGIALAQSTQNKGSCDKFDYIVRRPQWKNLQDVPTWASFDLVAGNAHTSAIWTVFNVTKESGTVTMIAKFDGKKKWSGLEELPQGALALAVNSKGDPSIVENTKERYIQHKKAGSWVADKVCAKQIAFGANDALYSLQCDDYVWKKEATRSKVSKRKAMKMSASSDGLWIVDFYKKVPFMFNAEAGEFEKKGNQEATGIYVGLKNNVLITDVEGQSARWAESTETWQLVDRSRTLQLATSLKGKLYKIDQTDKKLFQQSQPQALSKCLADRKTKKTVCQKIMNHCQAVNALQPNKLRTQLASEEAKNKDLRQEIKELKAKLEVAGKAEKENKKDRRDRLLEEPASEELVPIGEKAEKKRLADEEEEHESLTEEEAAGFDEESSGDREANKWSDNQFGFDDEVNTNDQQGDSNEWTGI